MSLRQAVRFLEQGAWEKAHALVQGDESRLACWVHGIVHLQEGDVGNARYWFARAERRFSANSATELVALADATLADR